MGDSLGPRFAELGYRVVYGSRKPESDNVKSLVEVGKLFRVTELKHRNVFKVGVAKRMTAY